MSGLCSAPPWMTASMPRSARTRSTSPRSATEPTTCVSAPGATSRPVTPSPSRLSRGARKRPSQPDEPVSSSRMAASDRAAQDAGLEDEPAEQQRDDDDRRQEQDEAGISVHLVSFRSGRWSSPPPLPP